MTRKNFQSWLQSYRPKFGYRLLAALIGFCMLLLFALSYVSTNIGRRSRFPRPATCLTGLKSVANTSKLHVLLLSYPRSGSSFLGDMLQSYNGTFYHFEPLHYFGDIVNQNQSDSGRKMLHDFFTCDYHDWVSFPKWVRSNSGFLTFRRSKRYWQQCTHRARSHVLCYNICFLAASCHNYPVQVIKTIRMAVLEAGKLLKEYTDLNLKVIHLVRDPRGIMNSRQHKDIAIWCGKYKACSSYETFCKLVNDDLKQACKIQKRYPNKFLLVRYEDLALDPPQTAEKIFKFLDIGPAPNEVVKFLETHTQGGSHVIMDSFLQPPYRTVRNSTRAVLQWCHKMKLRDIQKVQQSCHSVLNNLGYKMINHTSDLSAKDVMDEKFHFCAH